ncbi:unnamed protein product [Fraxinus pennsylvanica]|uniref:Uncharacterized protein n=1 Tax=Fraxinus pennsylvanica TaxID=56036 RepID=A0AAD2EDI7_9LAMI|nr:unnamed protein product [Fraxinus pennsylvanica]
MEGVGARLGRSSTRYAPATVFTGPVRKWKKKWIHITPSSSNQTEANGRVNGVNSSSHLLLYKWTPITANQNKENNGNDGNNESKNYSKDEDDSVEEPPKRKFKYIPIAVLEEQANESSDQLEDEPKPIETEINTVETTSKSDGHDEKPDINDVPMDDTQAPEENPVERRDLNVTPLDLSLGLKASDGENESNSKTPTTLQRLQTVEKDLLAASGVSNAVEKAHQRMHDHLDLKIMTAHWDLDDFQMNRSFFHIIRHWDGMPLLDLQTSRLVGGGNPYLFNILMMMSVTRLWA